MKLIKPSYEILTPTDWREWGIKKFIELIGRTCYKSEDKITDDSYKVFVQKMIDSRHYAMLEHGTIYITASDYVYYTKLIGDYDKNKYSVVKEHFDEYGNVVHCITTNLRVLIENGWSNDLCYLSEPTEYHAKRITVKFICNRQVSHEFVRHRVFSFAQESTRYCNYTKGKFGGELTFILPCWLYKYSNHDLCIDEDGHWDANTYYRIPNQSYQISHSLGQLHSAESSYKTLIENDWKPQQAATILPNALKTELVMTGFVKDWQHFFNLRALGKTGAPHPQAKELALPLYNDFVKLGYIKEK